MGAETTCLAYDRMRGIFYSGAYDYENDDEHHYFAKHIMEPNDIIRVKNIGHIVIDADVEEESGYVFTTGYLEGGIDDPNSALEMWDTSGWNDDPNQAVEPLFFTKESLDGPAGVLYVADDPLPPNIKVFKDDDVNDDPNYITCILPGEELTYTITIDPNGVNHAWVEVIDYLPDGVSFAGAQWSIDMSDPNNPIMTPPDPNYNLQAHTYTWLLGPLAANANPVELTLQVIVNERAEPLGYLRNYVTVESDVAFDDVYLNTPVCLFGGDVIFVDQNAPDGGNGTSWDLAYQQLSDGLDRALAMKAMPADPNMTVLVADGTYKPPASVTASFVVAEDASVYGGYAGYGATNPNERDPKKYKTILSGFIGYDYEGNERRNETVVEMQNNTLLDGITVEKGYNRGILGYNTSFSLTNCTVRNNTQRGISSQNGNLTMHWCKVSNNGHHGIYHLRNVYGNYDLSIKNCTITENQQNGIYINSTIPEILNCEISFNGSGGYYYGINLLNPSSNPMIRNCTIAYNANEGIRFLESTNYPTVWNCILFANNANDDYKDISKYNGYTDIWYCCLTDPNHLEGPPLADPPKDEQGNMQTYPGFAYPGPEYHNFHLAADSPCIDKGDPDEQAYVEADETDLDGDDRDEDGSVDIGADEVACWDKIGDPNDWNGDGVINYEEFIYLSRAWMSCDPNGPYYPNPSNPDPNDITIWYTQEWGLKADLNCDTCVDLNDLMLFSEPNHWLWEACWRHDLQDMHSMMGGGGESMMMPMPMTESFEITSVQTVFEPGSETLEQNVLFILAEVEQNIENNHPNLEGLYEMKEFLEEVLWDLQNANP